MSRSTSSRPDSGVSPNDLPTAQRITHGDVIEHDTRAGSDKGRPEPSGRRATPDSENSYSTGEALLRLLVGSALISIEELESRLRTWDDEARVAIAESAVQREPGAPSSAPWAYAPLGMLYEARARVAQGYRGWRARLRRMADEVWLYRDDGILEDDYTPTPVDELRMQLDDTRAAIEKVIDRWSARGQTEAQRGRFMARHTPSVVDDVLDYIAHNPELRRLIKEQATDVTASAVDEARDRSAAADQWIERVAHNLLRRPVVERQAIAPAERTTTTATVDAHDGTTTEQR